jgi:superfamily II DNA or RNA helicase
MSLSENVQDQFSVAIRQRGAAYFQRGLVELVAADVLAVEAHVRGHTTYGVTLDVDEEGLHIFCSCPYFAEHGPCKHVWATIMQADAGAVLQPPDAEPLPVHCTDAGTAAQRPMQHAPPAGQPPAAFVMARPPAPPPPLWQRQLDAAYFNAPPPATGAWAREHLIRYALLPPSHAFGDQRVQVAVEFCTRKKAGDWNTPRPLRVPPAELELVGNAQDQRLLALLLGAVDTYGGYVYSSYKTPACVSLRTRAQVDLLLPELIQTGRCFLRQERAPDLLLKGVDTTVPWRFHLEVRPTGKQDMFMVAGHYARAGETLDLLAPGVTALPGWLLSNGVAARLQDDATLPLCEALRLAQNKILVPAADADALLQRLVEHGRLPALTLPAEWQVRDEKHAPQFQLVIGRALNSWQPEVLPARCAVAYDGVAVNFSVASEVHFDPVRRRLLHRDAEAEQRALGLLLELGLKRNPYEADWPYQLNERRLNPVVCQLLALGWHIEAQGRPYRRGGVFNMTVSSGMDWFELRGAMDFDGQRVELPALLAALKKNEPLVKLGDGSFGILPEEWLKRYGRFAELGTEEEDHLRFARNQAGVLDALLAAQPEATCDALFAGVRKELETFSTIQSAQAPAGFLGKLRTYQREGLGWFHFLRRFGFGGCLADDMGLGKTIQVLALLEERRAARAAGADDGPRTSLVVAPRSLIFNWIAEAARFTPELRMLAHTGAARHATAEQLKDYDVVLTTYGTLRNDITHFRDLEFDCVILDEAQAIKNVAAATTKATRLLRARQRLALSGTPVQNHLGELWSLFEFLNPGMLGAASVFKLATAEPDEATRALLARALRPFILRRTKGQVARDLPARTEETIFCELEPKQRRFYDELRTHFRRSLLERVERDGLAKSKMHVLEALLRLRQAACHPGLIEKKHATAPSAKLDALLPQLAEVLEENHKALVFSQFTSLLALVRARLDAAGLTYEYLDGQTQDREACVRHFQDDPECKLFLISLKAGGLGLNLTAAEYVFLLDPWWNPAIEAQAIDRAHRIGQTQQVFAYRLIARDTVEEKILELQKTKRALADAIIGAENSLLGGLQRQDLELLLS